MFSYVYIRSLLNEQDCGKAEKSSLNYTSHTVKRTFFNNSELINREVGCVHLSLYVKCTPKKRMKYFFSLFIDITICVS